MDVLTMYYGGLSTSNKLPVSYSKYCNLYAVLVTIQSFKQLRCLNKVKKYKSDMQILSSLKGISPSRAQRNSYAGDFLSINLLQQECRM